MRILLGLLVIAAASALDDDWQPIIPESSLSYNTYIKTSDRALDTRFEILIFVYLFYIN